MHKNITHSVVAMTRVSCWLNAQTFVGGGHHQTHAACVATPSSRAITFRSSQQSLWIALTKPSRPLLTAWLSCIAQEEKNSVGSTLQEDDDIAMHQGDWETWWPTVV